MQALLEAFQGGHGQNELLVVDELVGVGGRDGNDVDVLEVAERKEGVHVVVSDNNGSTNLVEAQGLHGSLRIFGARSLEGELVNHGELLVGQLSGKRGAHSKLDFLAVHAERVRTGVGTEHGAAANPLRGADGTLAGTTGALLTPRLLAAAANFATGLSVSSALTQAGAIGTHDRVHHVDVRLDAEHGVVQLDGFNRLARDVFDVNSSHCGVSPNKAGH